MDRTSNFPYHNESIDLACAFRWAYRFGMYEAVANHFSMGVGEGKFLMNPDKRHFGLITASELLVLDIDDSEALDSAQVDETGWYLHSALQRRYGCGVCGLHVHSVYATVLASLQDSRMLAIDQNTAMFHGRVLIDEDYGGLALEDEGIRCADSLYSSGCKILVMGNHGVLVLGSSVAEAFFLLYYFERASETLIKAYQTGKELRILSDSVASLTSQQIADYDGAEEKFFTQLKELLHRDGDNFSE